MQAGSTGLKPLIAAIAVALGAVAASPAQAQEKVLRIAMTAADIPRTLGQPDQGFEGNRFTGIPIYDSLTQWDLSKSDGPSVMIPGLAESWAVDANRTSGVIASVRTSKTISPPGQSTSRFAIGRP